MNCTEKDALQREYRYKIELHAHTSPVSGCSDISPRRLIEICKEDSYSGVAVTNHFACEHAERFGPGFVPYYLNDYLTAREAGEREGVKVYLGMEIRFPGSINDYLVYGIDEEFVRHAGEYLKSDIKTFYRDMKNDRNVILQAHPFRNGIVPVGPDCIDGIETFNLHINHNGRIPKAQKYAEDNRFLYMCGTDLHHEEQRGLTATRTKVLPLDSFDIARLIRSGDFLYSVGNTLILP